MASAAVAAACDEVMVSGAGAPSVGVGVASPAASRTGVAAYYASKLDALQLALSEKAANLRRLEAQVREAARARRDRRRFHPRARCRSPSVPLPFPAAPPCACPARPVPQRTLLNAKVRALREELGLLQEPGSYIGEVAKAMAGAGSVGGGSAGGDKSKARVLVKTSTEGKYIVDIDKDIDLALCTPNTRVALRSDSYTLHRILPTKVDPCVSV